MKKAGKQDILKQMTALCALGFVCSYAALQLGAKYEKWALARIGLAGVMTSTVIGTGLAMSIITKKVLDRAEKKILDKLLPKIRAKNERER